MLSRLRSLFRRRDPLDDAARAVDRGRARVETVLGLPHRLAQPLLVRHFGDSVLPSDEEFLQHGRDGHWILPAPAAEFSIRLEANDEGRLVHGRITGSGPYAGLIVFSDWSPDHPAAVWQIRIEEPAGEQATALHDHLLDPERN